MLTFKQRMLIFLPIFIIALAGIYLLPTPYNQFVSFGALCTYWTIILIFDKRYEKKKKEQNHDPKR
ncbi:hypothetical protein CVD28_01945 [Bacillus sp. M6-12]|uniref:hypothetical protein n=1 Tax=Bacillus sp. M6-12 TaxID=2054166 RepID=UPI000C78601F|nr:hypothetical protein [Bacillus sp. M6-12]PLS19194.1 hypothetical protein CVD28_01945 [Bacillus sp. M6-12]